MYGRCIVITRVLLPVGGCLTRGKKRGGCEYLVLSLACTDASELHEWTAGTFSSSFHLFYRLECLIMILVRRPTIGLGWQSTEQTLARSLFCSPRHHGSTGWSGLMNVTSQSESGYLYHKAQPEIFEPSGLLSCCQSGPVSSRQPSKQMPTGCPSRPAS